MIALQHITKMLYVIACLENVRLIGLVVVDQYLGHHFHRIYLRSIYLSRSNDKLGLREESCRTHISCLRKHPENTEYVPECPAVHAKMLSDLYCSK
ncbi:hypothetical protein AVEN_195205-1 [Araneus ventricosus]|uniref:Uncharacterized protein n=1 Tax=Araneus ventricosus TaxID=182803 RepID=A0A4Y2G2A7_ARAVE|nr:hypothetical protein AVEN_195205-1 [Araneus ventricosus]